MLTFILALQAATVPIPAQVAIDPQTAKRSDIVVTSARLEEAERAWKACRKRNCPPDQEIHAALVHGENLFVAGDYARAGVGHRHDRECELVAQRRAIRSRWAISAARRRRSPR